MGRTLLIHCANLAFAAAALGTTVLGAAPVEVEIATERGLQITAPREWLQLLTEVGVDHVRVRSASRGEQPAAMNRGTDASPRYHVLGILTVRQQLLLPGGTFGRNDRAKLKDYFDRLAADGVEGVAAPRGRFGLTERQVERVLADLSQPLTFRTVGLTLQQVVDQLDRRLAHEIAVDIRAEQTLRDAAPMNDELGTLTAGTALAIALRNEGLALRPEKLRGQQVVLRVVPLPLAEDIRRGDDDAEENWPIGWESEARPRELAPLLFESVNAHIAGYSLREALDVLGPRIKVPLLIDSWALAQYDIDADQLQVEFPRQRTYYKRVLDRVLFQARLHGELLTDEAGTVFYWVTR
jgi:hypothetical protein